MPERITEHLTMLLYAIAAISGGLGGCAAAGYQSLRGPNNPRASFFLAYVSLGVLFGVLTLAYGTVFGVGIRSLDTLVGPCVLAGFGGSLSLASSNVSARWLLRRLGVEVEVTVRHNKRRKAAPDEHAEL